MFGDHFAGDSHRSPQSPEHFTGLAFPISDRPNWSGMQLRSSQGNDPSMEVRLDWTAVRNAEKIGLTDGGREEVWDGQKVRH
jgi:hypothetical protein